VRAHNAHEALHDEALDYAWTRHPLAAANRLTAPSPGLSVINCYLAIDRSAEVKPQSVTPYRSSTFDSPIGELKLVASSSGLAAVLWENDDPKRVRLGPTSEDATDAILIEARRQLKAYFAGDLKVFTLCLDFRGTDFQKSVWEALLTIPFGETRSYSDIARQIAKPKASRAVGAANGRNPISIIAPCHRVIGSNGALTGFAGGIAAKEYLLRLERA
jgi:methylated-DNA-[protein]-cysteine S-methyltransferase